MNIKTALLTLMTLASLTTACSTTAPLEPVATSCAGQIVNGVCNPPSPNNVPPVTTPAVPSLNFSEYRCGRTFQGRFLLVRNETDTGWIAGGSEVRTVIVVNKDGLLQQVRQCSNTEMNIAGNQAEEWVREMVSRTWGK